MAAGKLRAVVATSTLDLGIDWGDVDLVIHVGAPKGASRFIQRIGRANHRLDEPSRGILVPANRFEVLECRAAQRGRRSRRARRRPCARRRPRRARAARPRHGVCRRRSIPTALFAEVRSALPYAGLTRAPVRPHHRVRVDRRLRAQSLRSLREAEAGGRWPVARRQSAHRPAIPLERRHHRRHADDQSPPRRSARGGKGRRTAGRARAGRSRGRFRRAAAASATTFVFAGEVLRFEGAARDRSLRHARLGGHDPIIPSYDGGKFPLSTHLAGARPRHAGRSERVARRCRCRSRIGSTFSRALGHSRRPTRCWSKPSRAAAGTSWSPIRSKGASPIRRSACC